jgi:hypothetical protein
MADLVPLEIIELRRESCFRTLLYVTHIARPTLAVSPGRALDPLC